MTTLSGTVQAPGGQVAFNSSQGLLQQFAQFISPTAYASVSGLSPVPDGTTVQLIRLNAIATSFSVLSSTSTTGGRYSFNLTDLNLQPSNDLAVRVANGAVQMRAFLTGSKIDIDPASEASFCLVLDQIVANPGATLSQFTLSELRDITGAVNQLAAVKQLAAGLNIDSTVISIKSAVLAEAAITAFIAAGVDSGETTQGPGDIGNYFPIGEENLWRYQGTVSLTSMPTVNFSDSRSINGTKVIEGVTTTIFFEENHNNEGTPEENYEVKDSRGVTSYGNNDSSDFITPQLVPLRTVRFPLAVGDAVEVVNRKGLDSGLDLDGDGKTEKMDVELQYTVLGFETVTVPAGTFSNAAKVESRQTNTFFSSAFGISATIKRTETDWLAPGVGFIKKIEVNKSEGFSDDFTQTVTEALTEHTIKNLGFPKAFPTNGLQLLQTAIGDLNGDGRNDVAAPTLVGATAPTAIAILYQNSQGQFDPPVSFSSSPDIDMVSQIAVGDLNNDGKADLVFTGRCGPCKGLFLFSVVVVRYQNPTNGTLMPAQAISWSGTGAFNAAIGDINSDGRNDLVVSADQKLYLFYQQPTGNLAPALVYDKLAPYPIGEIHIADMDNDGDKDVVVQNDYKRFAVIKQNSSVVPPLLDDLPTYYSVPISASMFEGFAVGDINGDGKNDVVIADPAGGVDILIQNSKGTLDPPILLASSVFGKGIRIADINLDGLKDIVRDSNSGVNVYLQSSDNHALQTPTAYEYQELAGGGLGYLSVGDVTGDGKPDVVAPRQNVPPSLQSLLVVPNITH